MPPIIINRATGAVKSAPKLTQAQSDKLWEMIVREYARQHPEIFDRKEEPKCTNCNLSTQ